MGLSGVVGNGEEKMPSWGSAFPGGGQIQMV